MTMGLTECFGCGKKFDDSFSFCPYCGRKKGASIEEMRDKETREIEEAIENNVKTYRKEMKDTSEILEMLKEKDKTTVDIQEKLTVKILNRFPEIEKRMREDPDIEFKAFIIDVPYKREDAYLHHCMLEALAKKHDNIANFALGVEELASDLYEVHIPVWTNDSFGELAVRRQSQNLKKAIPPGQKKFMYVAEPWYFLNRVHDFDGRWIDWKVLFKIDRDEFKNYTEEFHEVPLNIQKFSDLKYANYFSTVGTAFDGESFLGIVEKGEISELMRRFRSLESLFPQDHRPTLELIKISWDLMKELGFFCFSLKRLLKEPYIFSKYMSQNIMETAKDGFTKFTEKGVLRKKLKKDDILDIITDELITMASREQKGSMSEIARPIPRNIRNEYRIFGGAK